MAISDKTYLQVKKQFVKGKKNSRQLDYGIKLCSKIKVEVEIYKKV